MQTFHGLLCGLRPSLICFYIIYMIVPIIGLKLKWSGYFKENIFQASMIILAAQFLCTYLCSWITKLHSPLTH